MRRAVCRSSLSNSLSAAGSSSTFHAMALHHFGKRYGLGSASAYVDQTLFGQIQIFKVVQMFANCGEAAVRFSSFRDTHYF